MTPMRRFLATRWRAIATAGVVFAVAAAAAALAWPWWWPEVRRALRLDDDETVAESEASHEHAHGPGGHSHGPEAGTTHRAGEAELELSEVARKNIGLRTREVELRTYVKTVSVPAMVVERPGRSQVEITAPVTGVVTRVFPTLGEAIQPGQPLFQLRLTHEDLVNAQRNFLQSVQELDVVVREIERLEMAGDGVIPMRQLLEQQYEEQKLEAAIHAQRQGLLLHGLSSEQIEAIMSTRELLQMLTVTAPPFDEETDHHETEHLYHVQQIAVRRGQHVVAGEALGMLADHCVLYVEGQAFEEDADFLTQAAREGWPLEVESSIELPEPNDPLTILYVADEVDLNSRALRFYMELDNELIRDQTESGHRFVAWKFRPGQRMAVSIPTGQPWQNQIVLPPSAVVDEGAESFVFQQHEDHFVRIPVHVLHRDRDAVVIENDGRLPGTTLAMTGAYQMHLAIKNQLGGGDAYGGHGHSH